MDYLKSLQVLQHAFLTAAKQQITKFGSATPVLIGCTHVGLVPARLAGLECSVLVDQTKSQTDEVLAFLDLTSSGSFLFNTLCATAKNEETKAGLVEAFKARQKFAHVNKEEVTEDKMMRDVVEVICKLKNISEKDIQAMGMAWFLRQIEAHAAIFITEAWMAHTNASKEDFKKLAANGLANYHGSKEVVMSQLETSNHISVLSSQILRDSKDKDKIVGFGEIEELNNSDPSSTITGRFTDLLKIPSNKTIH